MDSKQYQIFGYRWVMLATFGLIAFIAGMGFNAVAPLLNTVSSQWSVTFATAALLMSVFGFAQMLMSLPSGWLAGKVGFRWPIVIGASLLAAGFLLRPLASSYAAFMGFSIIAALGWGLIWSPVGSMIATWFPHQEIGLANSLWPVGLTGGQAFGVLTSMPFLIAFGWASTWWVYAIIALVVALASWVLIRSHPTLPPEPRPPFQPAGLAQGISQTMNRTNWALQYTVFATVGSIAAAPMLIAPMLIGHGVSPATAGVTSGLSLVGGVLGAFFVPMLAFRKQVCRVTALLAAILAAIFFYLMFMMPANPSSVVPVAILSFLFGFCGLPVMGISLGVGQMQPGVNPGNAGILTGVYLTSIGVGAAIFPALIGAITEAAGVQTGGLVLAILVAISSVLIGLLVPEPESLPKAEPQPRTA